MPKFYLTTAIDYSNGDPHLGHALEKVGADCIARYRRLRGDQVHFLMGMDEHSQAVVQAAEQNGHPPQVWVDLMADPVRGVLEPARGEQRRLDSHHGAAPPGGGHRAAPAHRAPQSGRSLRRRLRGSLLHRLRGVQAAGPDRERPLHRAPDARAGSHQGAQSLLPAEPLPRHAAPTDHVGRVPGRAGHPAQRDPPTARGRAPGHLGLAPPPVVGDSLPRRFRSDRLRLVRRAHQLSLRHRLPRPGLRATLARRSARRRQGDHPFPLRDLARDAAGRRRGRFRERSGPTATCSGKAPRCPRPRAPR